MTWKRYVSPAEAHQRFIKDATEAVQTKTVPELEDLKKALKKRLARLEAGAEPDKALGALEGPELHRIVRNINERIAYLGRVAAGGTDPGRQIAAEGESPLHGRLREAYAELDRLEEAGADTTNQRALVARLKKALAEGLGGEVASPEDIQDRKRRERRYAGAL